MLDIDIEVYIMDAPYSVVYILSNMGGGGDMGFIIWGFYAANVKQFFIHLNFDF